MTRFSARTMVLASWMICRLTWPILFSSTISLETRTPRPFLVPKAMRGRPIWPAATGISANSPTASTSASR